MRPTLHASCATPTTPLTPRRPGPAFDRSPPDAGWRTGTLHRRAPATCGELVQGALDGRDFLVNCPIDRYSRATLTPSATPGYRVEDAGRFGKVVRALELLGRPSDDAGYRIDIASDVPRGKGMASSSADVAAALAAVAERTGRHLEAAELTRLVTRVEPSDCVHLPGIAHVDHLNGEVLDRLPAPRGLGVVVVDAGGEIDTVGFDRERARAVYRAEQPSVLATLALLRHGLRRNHLANIAVAATASARLSQHILPKPHLESLLGLVSAYGALGINCAHSGTVLGVLYRTDDGIAESLIRRIRQRFGSALEVLGTHRVIGGGCS